MSEDLKTVLQILSGGATGAFITAIVNHFKNKIPKIDHNFKIEPVFNGESKIGKYELRLLFIIKKRKTLQI